MLTFLCEIAVLETLGSFCQVRAQIPSWSLICPGGATGSTCPIRGKKVFPCQWDGPSASSVVVLAAMDSHSSRTEDLGHPASTRAPNPCTSSRMMNSACKLPVSYLRFFSLFRAKTNISFLLDLSKHLSDCILRLGKKNKQGMHPFPVSEECHPHLLLENNLGQVAFLLMSQLAIPSGFLVSAGAHSPEEGFVYRGS